MPLMMAATAPVVAMIVFHDTLLLGPVRKGTKANGLKMS